MEGRRAQGFPDNEVIVGRPSQQWKIVGNSVSRQVALVLGLSLREARVQSRHPIFGDELLEDSDGTISDPDMRDDDETLSVISSPSTITDAMKEHDTIVVAAPTISERLSRPKTKLEIMECTTRETTVELD